MNSLLEELFANLEPESEPESEDTEDEVESEDQDVRDFEQEGISHEAWIADVIARRYYRKGVIGKEGFPFIAMELVEGETVKEKIKARAVKDRAVEAENRDASLKLGARMRLLRPIELS